MLQDYLQIKLMDCIGYERNEIIADEDERAKSKRQISQHIKGLQADWFQHCGPYKLCSSAGHRRISREQRHSPALHGTIQRWSGFQNPGQIVERIQSRFLGRLDQAVDHRAGLGAQRGIGKQEVLAANHEGLDAALGPVVAQLQPSVLQIANQIRPLLFEVMQSFAQRGA